jgi:hypothetical protein
VDKGRIRVRWMLAVDSEDYTEGEGISVEVHMRGVLRGAVSQSWVFRVCETSCLLLGHTVRYHGILKTL